MRPTHAVAPLLLTLLAPAATRAHHVPDWPSAGSLVSITVEMEGRALPLYPAPDGSGRFYLEARRGGAYSLRLASRSHERLAVLVSVDGLNVVSGDREAVPAAGTWSRPGRMYVLEPWTDTLIQGWRTSLAEVRRFEFVDEERSYATRSGKANAKMGWIEVAVYRERPRRLKPVPAAPEVTPRDEGEAGAARKRNDDQRSARPESSSPTAQGYPGTGWGPRTEDHVVVVDFQPQPTVAEKVTLRYEYASGLRALGIIPERWTRDRLRERDRGQPGFAEPPRW